MRHPSIISNSNSLLSYHVIGYLQGQSIEFLIDEVLPEIQKALSSQIFDDDAGGITTYLTIGANNCKLSGDNALKSDVSIPTSDVRDLLLVWTTWVKQNGLEQNPA